jgi:uncharacterized membrane protein YobD (UPF0266 family)
MRRAQKQMDIGSLIIVGVIVSLFVQWLKNVAKAGEYTTLAIVVAVSLVAGLFYQLFSTAPWWQGAIQTLAYAGAAYTFLIERFKK